MFGKEVHGMAQVFVASPALVARPVVRMEFCRCLSDRRVDNRSDQALFFVAETKNTGRKDALNLFLTPARTVQDSVRENFQFTV
jgi:hypothetical protein